MVRKCQETFEKVDWSAEKADLPWGSFKKAGFYLVEIWLKVTCFGSKILLFSLLGIAML